MLLRSWSLLRVALVVAMWCVPMVSGQVGSLTVSTVDCDATTSTLRVQVTFANVEVEDVWIGVYPDTDLQGNEDEVPDHAARLFVDWATTCGTKTPPCTPTWPQDGSIIFDGSLFDDDKSVEYRAVLVRSTTILTSSPIFRLMDDCNTPNDDDNGGGGGGDDDDDDDGGGGDDDDDDDDDAGDGGNGNNNGPPTEEIVQAIQECREDLRTLILNDRQRIGRVRDLSFL
jgi:hypothetical protein